MSNLRYAWRLAWREGRKQRNQLLLFMSSIILGIAALVAINSFNDNLIKDIDRQTASLIGADLRLTSNKAFSDAVRSQFRELPGEDAEQWDMLTMAYFPKIDKGQFVRLRGSTANFPFYGKIKTQPSSAISDIQETEGALVDEGLLQTLSLQVGDSIKIGNFTLPILGALTGTDAGAAMSSSFAPGVRISLNVLQQTDLVQEGSLVDFGLYKKAEKNDIAQWLSQYDDVLQDEGVSMESVEDRKEQMGEAFSYLNQFLNMVALIALILGCIGVASSVIIYIKRKENIIAILRCLGMSGKLISATFFLQIFFWGLISVILGSLLGSVVQLLIPKVFAGLIPYDVSFSLSPVAILEGVLVGSVITGLFCLLPLVDIQKVSPLRALRPSYQSRSQKRGLWFTTIGALILATLWGYLVYLTSDVLISSYFLLAILLTFGLLYGFAEVLVLIVKRFFPRSLGFAWRQGLASLFRPNNRTALLMMAIGTGVAIIGVLIVIQSLLLHNVQQMGSGEQPNVVLYGIQSEQLPDVQDMSKSLGLPIIQSVPVVTVDLKEWKGRTQSEWKQDTTADLEEWVFRRETRVSYRDHLEDNEELIRGDFPHPYKGDSIFVSLGDGYAEGLDVDLGDEIVFDVQGVRMVTYVGSIRKIDFANLQARFFILFPEGLLEKAPQFHVMVTKTDGSVSTTSYRNKIAAQFPNVSVIDLSSILEAVSDILKKVSYVIQFMAGFSLLTGLIVLFSALYLSKFQRVKEGVLLRTLGAEKRTILLIHAIEYGVIGLFASLLGMGIAVILAYLLSTFQFGLSFQVDGFSLFMVAAAVMAITMTIGYFSGKEVNKSSPLEVLREWK